MGRDGTGAFWQTETIEEFPVVLKVDLGKVYGIKEMSYKPRQSEDCHGAWGLVSVYVSTDGENWEAAATGVKMPINRDIKTITFDKEIEGFAGNDATVIQLNGRCGRIGLLGALTGGFQAAAGGIAAALVFATLEGKAANRRR